MRRMCAVAPTSWPTSSLRPKRPMAWQLRLPAGSLTAATPALSGAGCERGAVPRRANELADFIAEAKEAYGLAAPIAVGFSNGANIAAAVLMLRPEALAGAALLRAMVPRAG